jgi:hypothetical protein
MSIYQFLLVLIVVELGAGVCFFGMRRIPARKVDYVMVVLGLAMVVGGFLLGDHFHPQDYTCHPSQHCYPWGD